MSITQLEFCKNCSRRKECLSYLSDKVKKSFGKKDYSNKMLSNYINK